MRGTIRRLLWGTCNMFRVRHRIASHEVARRAVFRDRAVVLLGMVVVTSGVAFGQAPSRRANGEPTWTYGVVRTGDERDAIKSLPVTERPYRPLHFYGNTVRRLHYRGTPLPAPRDVVGAGAATILRK